MPICTGIGQKMSDNRPFGVMNPDFKFLAGNSFLFQHDSDPKHIANAVKSSGQWKTIRHGLATPYSKHQHYSSSAGSS